MAQLVRLLLHKTDNLSSNPRLLSKCLHKDIL